MEQVYSYNPRARTGHCQSGVKLKLMCITHTPTLQCCDICQWWMLQSDYTRQSSAQLLAQQTSVTATIALGCLCLYWHHQVRDQTISAAGQIDLY